MLFVYDIFCSGPVCVSLIPFFAEKICPSRGNSSEETRNDLHMVDVP